MTVELRIEAGKRLGEVLRLAPGEHRLGTASSNEVLLRERGIAFRHAVLRVDPSGGATLADLGSKAPTWVNGEPLADARALHPGDRLRLGDALELLLLEPPAPDPLGAALALIPEHLLELAPPRVQELLETAAGAAVPLDEARAALASDEQRAQLDADAASLVLDAQRLFRPGLLDPAAASGWLRRLGDDELAVLHTSRDGARLLWRRWELVARVPGPPLDGEAAAAAPIPWLLHGGERLLPQLLQPLDLPGWYRLRYASDKPLLRRFERIEAITDGRVVAAELVPSVGAHRHGPLVAEDALEDAIRDRAMIHLHRPAARGAASSAPPLPTGGRYGRTRHRPKRTRSE